MQKLRWIAPVCLICLCFHTYSQSDNHKTYQTSWTKKAPVIDGVLNDQAWDRVDFGSGFSRTTSDKKESASFQTKFKIIYDHSNLYVAFRCFDNEPEKILAPISTRDTFEGDWVEINIDRNNNQQTATSFTLTAAGIRGDEFISDDGANWDNDWNPKWYGKTHLDSTGWTAEFEIPLEELEYDDTKNHWGIQFTRRIGRTNERSSWVYIPEESDKWVSLFGKMDGLDKFDPKPPSNYDPDYLYSAEQLKEDLTVLRNALEDVYPSYHRFRSKTAMDHIYTRIDDQLSKSSTALDFYKLILPMVDAIGDGHLEFKPSEDLLDHLIQTSKRIPFKLKIVDQAAYILEDYSRENTISRGTRIVAIDGVPIREIIGKLSKFVTSDGYNQTSKEVKLSSSFGFYYALLRPHQEQALFEFLQPDGKEVVSVPISLLLDAEIQKNRKDRYPHIREKIFDFHLLEDSIAYMKIRTFNWPEGFQRFVDSTFLKMKRLGTETLILDLRKNGGGEESNGMYLFAHLTDQPFKYFYRYETNLIKSPESISSYQHFNSFENLKYISAISSLDKSGRSVVSDFENSFLIDPYMAQQPNKNAFKGNLYVLIGGKSFSATSEFCAMLHKHQRATFVGQETGGTYHGNTSGIKADLILPHSKLRVFLPLIKYVSAVDPTDSDFGRGILPDFEIIPSTKSIISKEDEVLSFTLRIARKNDQGPHSTSK